MKKLIDVPYLDQSDDAPTGCESVSAVMLLQYLGFSIDIKTFIDRWLPKGDFETIDGELYANEVVGDGVGLSSVHGSTAYYRSITHSIFRVGLGLAFSNSTEEVSHLVLSESSVIEIEVVRGPGVLIADNSPEQIVLNEGEKVLLFESELQARIYGLANFMCPKCRLLRHPNKLPFRGFHLL